jgi:NAD(P)H-flavin reductase
VAKSAGEPLKTLDFEATPVSLENKDRVAEATVYLPKGVGQDHYLAAESQIEISGPFGKKFYLGNGKFSISGKEIQTKRIAFITDEYGIGEFYSILRQINADESDKTRSLILYQIDNEENCALKQSLHIFDEREYLTIHMHVINPSKMWKGFSGEIDQDHLIESLEDPLDNLTIFVKLSPARQRSVLGMLKQIRDVKPENVIPWEDVALED